MKKNVRYLTTAAMIAAVYVVLCLVFEPISYGAVQVRIAEALSILPLYTSAAVPGLTIGCLLANLFGGANILDVIFGTLATLLGAVGSRLLRKYRYLVCVPPIITNTVIIPFVLRAAYGEAQPIGLLMLSVGGGELLSCGVLGTVLMLLLWKQRDRIFG